jgi:hypothetical protein
LQSENSNGWTHFIQQISKVYSGPLTVSLNWDSLNYNSWIDSSHISALGIDAYFPWTGNSAANPTNVTIPALGHDWDANVLAQINALHQQAHRPIILSEVG